MLEDGGKTRSKQIFQEFHKELCGSHGVQHYCVLFRKGSRLVRGGVSTLTYSD